MRSLYRYKNGRLKSAGSIPEDQLSQLSKEKMIKLIKEISEDDREHLLLIDTVDWFRVKMREIRKISKRLLGE